MHDASTIVYLYLSEWQYVNIKNIPKSENGKMLYYEIWEMERKVVVWFKEFFTYNLLKYISKSKTMTELYHHT